MDFDGGDFGSGILIGDGERFSTGSGAAVKDADFALSAADQDGDQLRSFILDNNACIAKSFGVGDVAGENTARRGEKAAGFEFDPLRIQFGFRCWGAEADCGAGDELIVPADLGSRGDSLMLDPALH